MSAPTEEDDRDSKIDGDCHASVRYFIAMTGKSAPRHRTTERYRAAQGKNDYTNLPHDLAARPAGKFQFISPSSDKSKSFYQTGNWLSTGKRLLTFLTACRIIRKTEIKEQSTWKKNENYPLPAFS